MTEQKSARNDAAVSMFRDGKSFTQIAAELSISRQRAMHIVEREAGLDAAGGHLLSAALKRLDAACKQEAACFAKHGVCIKTFAELKALGVVRAFQHQRVSAGQRGIAFNFTLGDWWKVWADSGKWSLRGRGEGSYCMARNGDVGPYERGNVSIKTVQENSSEGQYTRVKRSSVTGAANRTSLFGSGRGWTYVTKSKRKPYCVQIRGLKQNNFATQEEAESFYKTTTAAILAGTVVIERGELVHGDQHV
jgi:hypothetical protein